MPPPQQAPEEGGQQQSKITGIVRSVAMFFAVQMGQFALPLTLRRQQRADILSPQL